jgi:uncharacterized RDD family membrane protein YckC
LETIKINTTQNVTLSYNAAGVGPRILSGLLDAVFVTVYYVIVLLIFFNFVLKRNLYSGSYAENEDYNNVMYGIMILCLLPALIYNLLCEIFLNGQSFGKKIMKIKVVKLDGTQPNFGSYLVRSMFRLIDRPLIAVIAVAVSKNSQRFGDMVAGTTVIQINRPVSIRETILYKQKPQHKITYDQVAMMSDADANTIREVIVFARQQNQPQHLDILSSKIRTKYGIHEVKQTNEDFLNTLLEDYSHYQFEK